MLENLLRKGGSRFCFSGAYRLRRMLKWLFALGIPSLVLISTTRSTRASLARSPNFQALISQREFFHRHVRPLGIHGTADVLDNPRPHQSPSLDRPGAFFILKADR